MNDNTSRIIQRIYAAELLLDFYRRGMAERNFQFSSIALNHRRDMLRAMREKRGYER